MPLTREEAEDLSGNLLSKQEAAAFLGVSLPTLTRILARHEIEVVRLSRKDVRFRKAALIDYLDRRIEPPIRPVRNGKAKSS